MSKKHTPLGKKIKRAREQAGYSQRQLGEYLKVSDKAISSYEVGRSEPSIDQLKQLSRVTHHPIQYFLDDEMETSPAVVQAKLEQIEQELLTIRRLLKRRVG